MHGYSLQFKFTFGCPELDNKTGLLTLRLKPLKAWLVVMFDHKLCLDKDDPMKDELLLLESKGLAEIRQFDGVGAEKFAEHAWAYADRLIRDATNDRCWCESCECAEHGANSAIFTPFSFQKTLYKKV